jgi:hypothetical protein
MSPATVKLTRPQRHDPFFRSDTAKLPVLPLARPEGLPIAQAEPKFRWIERAACECGL